MLIITCIGRDKQKRTFQYSYKKDLYKEEWTFKVETIPALKNKDFFEMTVAAVDDSKVRVIMANHHGNSEYSAMGIPEALLPIIKKDLGKNVESSPKTSGESNGIFRILSAEKYWQRLVSSGKATYNLVTDIYTVN